MRLFGSASMVVVALAVTFGLSACGDGDNDQVSAEDRDQITAKFAELQKAFAADDPEAICQHMTLAAQERAAEAAHGGSDCADNLERFFGMIRSGGGFKPSSPKPRIVAMEKAPRGVTVTVRLAGGPPTDLPFVEGGGAWKLDSLFGISASEAKRYASGIESAPFPPPRGERIEVTDEDGRPCPDFKTSFGTVLRRVTGGCTFEVIDMKYRPISVSTVFGDFELSDCYLGFRGRVDSSGRTWTTEAVLGALGGGLSACGDIYRCTSDPATEERQPGLEWPWKGRISSDGDGGYVNRIKLCWETCVGMFAGDLVLRLRRDGDTWRGEAHDTRIAESGLTIENWNGKVTKGGFEIKGPA